MKMRDAEAKKYFDVDSVGKDEDLDNASAGHDEDSKIASSGEDYDEDDDRSTYQTYRDILWDASVLN
jgi:hypothetical protein